MKIACCAAMLISTALVGHAWAKTPEIVDGSFEDIPAVAHAFTPISQQTVGGWTASPLPKTYSAVARGEVEVGRGVFEGHTAFGSQYLVLGEIANRSARSSESQTIDSLTPGSEYSLSFYYAVLDGAPAADLAGGILPGIQVVLNDGSDGLGEVLADETFTTDTVGPYGLGLIPFIKETVNFTAQSSDSRLTFFNQSYHSEIGLDNVAIAAVSAAPEPQTWLLMLVGVALVGAALRQTAYTKRQLALSI